MRHEIDLCKKDASMSILAATCATLAAMLAAAQPGDTVKLQGDCGEIVVANRFPRVVTIDARKANVKGLRITGANITILGGVFAAPAGMDGFAGGGYAIDIRGARDIRITSALVTNAKKGIVLAEARNVTIDANHFWRLREDGIIVSRTENLVIERNRFTEFQPRPTHCNVGGVVTQGLAKRACAGTWTDGNHADAVQMRDGVVNARIRSNTAEGDMQGGIGQFDTTGDAPLERVLIEGNRVKVSGFHSITLDSCIGCAIRNNIVRRGHPERRAVIRPGTATRCGNDAQDEKSDGAC